VNFYSFVDDLAARRPVDVLRAAVVEVAAEAAASASERLRRSGSAAVPPASNTGGKLTRAGLKGLKTGLDWLSFGGPSSRMGEVKTCNVDRWGEPELVERGGCSYQRQWRWTSGAVLFFSDGREDCLLSCPGGCLGGIDALEHLRLLRQMHGLGFHTTRVDARVDDWERVIDLELVHAAAEAGNFTSFRLTQGIQPKKLTADGVEKIGDSRTFGRRGADGSGSFYRIYDKNLESKGEIDCIRWENEFSGDKAREVGRQLTDCDDVEQLQQLCGALVGGHIDFRVRGDETHVDRRPRLGWWATFLEQLGRAVLSIERTTPPLQAALASCARQYKNVLAQARIVCEGAGGDFLQYLREFLDRACGELDVRRMESRDCTLNIPEAFRLRGRVRASVPLMVAR
jgi:hypothetical protein